MKRYDIEPIDSPREFRPSELFFSITDPRGVIVSGNQVFVRVSGHELGDLIGAPHNIIRHPDMPRAAFKLLWDHLLAGEKVAAYVKNMAKDGRYYWVVAFVAPIEGGFLSIRFLPTSPLRDAVEGVYGTLRGIEEGEEAQGDWKAGMALAGEKLGEVLASLGFASYDEFMRHLVHTELGARRDAIRASGEQILPALPPATRDESGIARDLRRFHHEGQELYRRTADFETALRASMTAIEALDANAKAICEMGAEFRYLSTNITLKAARLGLDGKVLSVIGSRLAEAAGQITRIVKHLQAKAAASHDRLKTVLFEMEWSELQLEMVVAYYGELWQELVYGEGAGNEHWDQNCRDLRRRQAAFDAAGQDTVEGLHEFGKSLHELSYNAAALHEAMMTIEVTHVSGLIESKRLIQDGGCASVFDSVRRQIDSIKGNLDGFRKALRELSHVAQQTPAMALAFADAVDLLRRVEDRLQASAGAYEDSSAHWGDAPAGDASVEAEELPA